MTNDEKKQQTAAPVVAEAPKTEADKMWSEIKDRSIEMFALPGQTVAMHAIPVPIDPAKLYLTLRSTAVLPSLEESLKKDFNVELAAKWVVVTRKPPEPAAPKK